MNIVLVEDDIELASLVKLVCQEKSITCNHFLSGEDAMIFLQQNDVHTIILDLRFSLVTDGLTLMEEIRRNEENQECKTPVNIAIFSGAEINETVLRVTRNLNVRRIFQKPYDAEEMISEIQKWGNSDDKIRTTSQS